MKGTNLVKVPGELYVPNKVGIVVSADGVKDYKIGKTLEEINDRVYPYILKHDKGENLFANSGFTRTYSNWSIGGATNNYSLKTITSDKNGLNVEYDSDIEAGDLEISQSIYTSKGYYVLSFSLEGEGMISLTNFDIFNQEDKVASPDNISDKNMLIVDGESFTIEELQSKIFNSGKHYIYFYKLYDSEDTYNFYIETTQEGSILFSEPMLIQTLDITKSWILNDEDIYAQLTDLNKYVNNASYNATTKKIEWKHDSLVIASIDASVFLKDGMVKSAKIEGTDLVITFNADTDKDSIRVPLADLANPIEVDTTNNIMKFTKDNVTYYASVSVLQKPNTPTITTTTQSVVTGNATFTIKGTTGTTLYSLDNGTTWTSGNSIIIASGFSNDKLNTIKTLNVKLRAFNKGEYSDIGESTLSIVPKVADPSISISRNLGNDDYSTLATITLNPSPTTHATSQYIVPGGSWTTFTTSLKTTTTLSLSAGAYLVRVIKPDGYVDATNANVSSAAITLNAKKFYYGFGGETLTNEREIQSLTGGNSLKSKFVAGNYTVTNNSGVPRYIWFCGIGNLDVSAKNSSGFEVRLLDMKTIDGYHCYRTEEITTVVTDTITIKTK